MTQIVVDLEVLENRASTSLRRHVTDDVTTRRRATSGRRDTAFQSIEKRFRADLSRRLRALRVQVEQSHGRPMSDPTGLGTMPTIAVRPSTGAFTMPRPSRRRRVRYQSVTQSVYSLAIASHRTLSSPLGSRRRPTSLADSRNSLGDDPVTSPEVAGSRESMTSWTSDLSSAVFDASAQTMLSDSDLTATDGGSDVIANYSKSDEPETAQRVCNTRLYSDDVIQPATFDSRLSISPSYKDTASSSSHGETNSMPTVQQPIEEERERRLDYESETLQTQSSPTLEDSPPTLTSGRPAPDVTRYGAETVHVSALPERAVDVVPTSSSSKTGTGSSLEERRRSAPEEKMIVGGVYSRSKTVSGAVPGDVLLPPVGRGTSSDKIYMHSEL